MKVLVLGSSARAVAESVARAGHEPVAIDSFGDCDLKKIAEWRKRDKARPLGEIVSGLDVDGAVFASGIENRPETILELEENGARVLCSSLESVRRCRDHGELEKFCQKSGLSRPRTRFPSPGEVFSGFSGFSGHFDTLVKRIKSGAGIGVREWVPGSRLRDGEYLQERVGGVPFSIVFLADGKDAVLCGASRQLAGEPALGAGGFAWCGNIMPFERKESERDAIEEELRRAAREIASYFGLRGAAGADFMYDGGRLWLLEINPRISASFELVELLYGVNIFSLHLGAIEGRLPPERRGILNGPFRGKGIIYAPANLTAPDTGAWYNCARRDIPRPGSLLPEGAPICTSLTPPLASDADVMAYLAGEAEKIWKECGL
ncbi:MAG: ATP-grasp domain-containing protein [Synergistaceae bacterium]|jgi:predicted ATP-grasp superfamily ATP-dependent carboligase|nr:ATP-grasp domain-containing protein [Synergistaceae bacterium]